MTPSLLALAGRLLFNGLRYRALRLTGKPGRPQAVSLEITHRCIARCIMCNIWKIPASVPDLPLERWITLLSGDMLADLRELDITGGEPFIRSDLEEFFVQVAGLKRRRLRQLRSLAVTTNGFLGDRILTCVERILPLFAELDLELVMVCAMDAIGGLHEQIRNYPDAWRRVDETIQGLKRLRQRHGNLVIGLKTTVMPLNVGELDAISAYAAEHNLFTIISPCIITDARYLNPDRAADLVFSAVGRERMIAFYESDAFRWSYHADTVRRVLCGEPSDKPCSCGFNYFFVRSTGDVLPCPLIDTCIGNITEAPVEDLLGGRDAARFRRRAGRFPACSGCTEPGLERYALPYEGFHYLRLLRDLGADEFLQLHLHLGLDKYF